MVTRPAAVRARVVAMVACLAFSAALAQEADEKTYDGTWAVKLQAPDGSTRDATLVLDAYDGTWQDGGRRGGAGPCGGKKVPLTVQSSTRRLLEFTVWGDTVGPKCPTLTIMVRPLGAKVLEGAADLGSHGAESPEVHARHVAQEAAAGASAAASAAGDTKRVGSAGSIRLTRR